MFETKYSEVTTGTMFQIKNKKHSLASKFQEKLNSNYTIIHKATETDNDLGKWTLNQDAIVIVYSTSELPVGITPVLEGNTYLQPMFQPGVTQKTTRKITFETTEEHA